MSSISFTRRLKTRPWRFTRCSSAATCSRRETDEGGRRRQHGGLATQLRVGLRQCLGPATQGRQSHARRRVRPQEDGLPGEQIPTQAGLLIVHELGPQDHVGRERIDHVHGVGIGRL
jgi:hypothetical protein